MFGLHERPLTYLLEEYRARLALKALFVAEQHTTSLSIKHSDMLLHAQQVIQPNGNICDV